MGFPSQNAESIYRNPLDEVRRMLELKHKDHYKIYNLCSERSYDIAKFHSRVATYPFDDHNPPEFGQMRPFCQDVDRWLAEHHANVAVVHCKAGKGRTGLMICAYLLHRKEFLTAMEVLDFYGKTRTQDQKGVTIPSQRRYVEYYAALVSEGLQYIPVKMYLTSIVIDPLPQLGLAQQEGYIQFEVRQSSVRPYESQVYLVRRSDSRINIELEQPLLIVGDVKIDFSQKMKLDILGRPRYVSGGKLFHFWFNTFFIDRQRSSPLTHSFINLDLETSRSARQTRSAHSSGSPRPPPRALRPALSNSETARNPSEPVSYSNDSNQPGELHSPNGTCFASVQTVTGGPPARTVSIVGEGCDLEASNLMKHASISDDHLLQEQARRATEEGAESATQISFKEQRQRHSSVPQTARAQGHVSSSHVPRPRVVIPGKQVSVRLNKSQIDKAWKDKSGKFSDNFNVTLFLVRPNDQTLQEEFSRSNLVCQMADSWPTENPPSSEDSSDDDVETGHRVRFGEGTDFGEGGSTRSEVANSGMVRNRTEPANTLSTLACVQPLPARTRPETATFSQSTWI